MKVPGIIFRIALSAAFLPLLTVSAIAQEVKLKQRQVPHAVIAAFQSAYPQATVRGYNREKENGKIYYEVESVEGQTTRDVLYNPDGTLAEIEEGIAVGDLPAGVAEALRAKFPRAVITSAEKTTRGDIIENEAHAKMGKKRVSMEFDASGKPLKH